MLSPIDASASNQGACGPYNHAHTLDLGLDNSTANSQDSMIRMQHECSIAWRIEAMLDVVLRCGDAALSYAVSR